MKIIGLTGGIACGKSTVARMFEQLGAFIVDADAISHALTAPGGDALPAIRQAFGDEVFAPDGTLDRKALGRLVFAQANALKQLNRILHPMIRQRMEAQIQSGREQGAKVVVLDAPLLFETGMETMADIVLCVVADEETQLRRMAERDGLSREQALSRIRSQWRLAQKADLSDVLLCTQCTTQELRTVVQALYESWL